MVMGDKSGLTDDCTSGEFRDRASFDLPGVQEELVGAVIATGTPVVLVLVVGTPSCKRTAARALRRCRVGLAPRRRRSRGDRRRSQRRGQPRREAADLVPGAAGQVPVFYAHKASGGRSHPTGDYVEMAARPLYPFGHGLSYTTFELSEARVHEPTVLWNDELVVGVRLTNTGEREGDEVVQLYIRDPQASVTRPVCRAEELRACLARRR